VTWLPAGPAGPDPAALQRFWARARAGLPAAGLDGPFQVRWIGLDDDSTEQVLALIEAGDKTGTFTLPWIVARTGQPEPREGDCIVLIDFRGQPRLLVRLTAIEAVTFGTIGPRHTAVDGTPVRDLAVWKPLHTRYWNNLLEPFGLVVSDNMPVLVERFELLARTADLPGGART
jgi:uncharacterized protein YhfF